MFRRGMTGKPSPGGVIRAAGVLSPASGSYPGVIRPFPEVSARCHGAVPRPAAGLADLGPPGPRPFDITLSTLGSQPVRPEITMGAVRRWPGLTEDIAV